MQAGNHRYVLFYSKHCPSSSKVVASLSTSPLNRQVLYVCVDSREMKRNLPAWVKAVPTMQDRMNNAVAVGPTVLQMLGEAQQRLAPSVRQQQGPKQGGLQQAPRDGMLAAMNELAPSEFQAISMVGDNLVGADPGAASLLDSQYVTIGDQQRQAQAAGPSGSRGLASGKEAEITNAFERMVAARNNEMQSNQRRV
jgi:glutaredoxin-related protein